VSQTRASTSTSKFLSHVLRHAPDSIGLTLDPNGWVDVEELLARARAAGRRGGRGGCSSTACAAVVSISKGLP
jgi:RNA:NAD 2'-phosphotransferase (TPT1/KptA family)